MAQRKLTPIKYKEAADMLGRSSDSLKHAIGKGVFTPLPRNGLERFLAKEQVELFMGGKQFTLNALSQHERQLWEECHDIITQSGEKKSLPSVVSIEEQEEQLAQQVAERIAPKVLQQMAAYFSSMANTNAEQRLFPQALSNLAVMK